MRGELFGEEAERGLCLADDHDARGVFVEAVNDPRAERVLSAVGGEVRAVVEDGVDERAVGVSRGGVDDEASGFEDEQKVLVLVEDVKVDGFGEEVGCGWRGRVKADPIAEAEADAAFVRRGIIKKDVPSSDGAFDLAARERDRVDVGEEGVEASADFIVGDGEEHGRGGARHSSPDGGFDVCTASDDDVNERFFKDVGVAVDLFDDAGLVERAPLLDFISEDIKDVIIFKRLLDLGRVVDSDVAGDGPCELVGFFDGRDFVHGALGLMCGDEVERQG